MYNAIIVAHPERPFQLSIIKENDPIEEPTNPQTTVEIVNCGLDRLENILSNKQDKYSLDSVTIYGPKDFICGKPFQKIQEQMAPTKFCFLDSVISPNIDE